MTDLHYYQTPPRDSDVAMCTDQRGEGQVHKVRLLVKGHGKHTRTIVRMITVRTNRQIKVAMDGSVLKVLGVSLVK